MKSNVEYFIWYYVWCYCECYFSSIDKIFSVETISFKTRISLKYISGKIIELPLLGYNKNICMIYAMLCYISHSKENFNGV